MKKDVQHLFVREVLAENGGGADGAVDGHEEEEGEENPWPHAAATSFCNRDIVHKFARTLSKMM